MAEIAQPTLPLPRRLSFRRRLSLEAQWLCSRVLGAWLMWPMAVAWMKFVRGYRIRDISAVRRRFRQLVKESSGPLLVCPNHLTWIDSLLVQWALVPPRLGWRSSRLLAWNLPEKSNFFRNPFFRAVCYVGKCLPIVRGGERHKQRIVLDKVYHLMERRELVLAFLEGERSRSGRIDPEEITYGVGGMIYEIPECKVLCVYLRGERQEQMGVLPRSGELFSVDLRLLKPHTELRGLRGHRDLARQVAHTLCEMEQRYFVSR